MSITLTNVGGTLTGGSSLVLTRGNTVGQKAMFYLPSHTRLSLREVDFVAQPASTTDKDAGVARASAKVVLANRIESEACCNVKSGSVILDIGIRWSLNQDSALVDEAIDIGEAVIRSDAFKDAIIKMFLPQ